MAFCFTLLGVSACIFGATYYWDAGGGANTAWNNPANWDPDGVPAASDNAYIRPSYCATTGSWTITVGANAWCANLYVYAEEDANSNPCDVTFVVQSGATLTVGGTAYFYTRDASCDLQVEVSGTVDLSGNDVIFSARDHGTALSVNLFGLLTNAYFVTLDADRSDATLTIANGGQVSCNVLELRNGTGCHALVDVQATAGNPAIAADDEIELEDDNCDVSISAGYTGNVFMGQLYLGYPGSDFVMEGGTAVVGTSAVSGGFCPTTGRITCYSDGQGGDAVFYNLRMYLVNGYDNEITINDITVKNDWDVYDDGTGGYSYAVLDLHSMGSFAAEPCSIRIGNRWEFHGGAYPDFWNTGGYVTRYGSGYYSLVLSHGIRKTAGESYRIYFEYLDANGMQVLDDCYRGESSFDHNELSYSTFRFGQSGGRYITYNFDLIDTDPTDTLWWSCVDFEADGPSYNIYRASGYAGNIGCAGGRGELWGESYDYDPDGTVHWRGGPIPPSEAPTDFSGTAVNCSTAVWTWTDNSSNEDGFRIYDDSGVLLGSVGANVTSWTEYDLHAEQTYTRYVVAYTSSICGENESAPSNQASVVPNHCILGYISVWDGNRGKVDSLRIIATRDAPSGAVVKVATVDGKIGCADLVDTSDPNASPVRIHTNAGTKSWRRK